MKKLILLAVIVLLVAGAVYLKKHKETPMKISPIDTVFEQGPKNPYSKFFTGQTYLTMLNTGSDAYKTPLGNVTFEPGARTHWHKHAGGQILLVLNGEGRYQERGKELRVLKKGDVVHIPADMEHWHGAAPESWFVHISVEPNPDKPGTVWLEAVSDQEYK